ncbi:uncharacterized protein K02A2.6-like [Oryzias latipes]|uniref:uncharacterized protein K02A2.6-like n=1 Tax=Oryzias latipes TaxID=8090 RepID=UPI000CE166C7|nr:uncharacterized protein K02A2.6-like [Oryzias latipes]
MASNVPFPDVFLPCPGEPIMPFKTWIRMFENYLLVINAGGDAWPEIRLLALLLHCLGSEGQRIFHTLPETGTTLATAIAALRAHFTPTVNVVVERHTFRKRVQGAQEPILHYIAALRELASTCDFANADDMIRDQLVEHVADPRIRERLLLKTNLTLADAITLATQAESVNEQARSMAGIQQAPVQVVTTQKSACRRRQPRQHFPAKHVQKSNSTPSTRTCFRCGSEKHLANSSECQATKATCRNCNKRGHFARVCRSLQTHTVKEVELPEYTLLLVDRSVTSGGIQVTVNIKVAESSQSMKLTVDTGAAVSILPLCIYEEKFKGAPLHQPTVQLVTYSRTSIPVIGCMEAIVHIQNLEKPATFHIVDSGTALMGRDLIAAFNLRIEGNAAYLPSTHFLSLPSAALMECSVSQPAAPATLGCAVGFIHKVKVLQTAVPVRQKLRRLPFSVRSAVSEELNRLLSAGVIERIDASPWVSPIVVTQRKNGKIRMCVDLREPNKAIVVDSFPLPHMEELLSALTGATLFSTIDLESAYHQVLLHPDSRDLTAFITHEGLFRFCRVPYGLASAPSAFQKLMATVLHGVPNVQFYLDDIICYGRTAHEHDAALETVRQKLKTAGLQLNDKKCHFRQTSLKFLGHLVTAEGIKPDTEHLQAITQAPAPSDAVSLRSFLGMLSWYGKFIPNYATVVEPLRACLRQGTQFVWTEEAQRCFLTVKRLLLESPALALFNPELPTIISTDASDYGVGAVFSQLQPDNTERTVAFASRTLSSTERKYSTVEKEALACVWAVEKWRTYLWGRKFTLRTDHQALTTLLTTKGADRAGMRIARWSARLLSFTYDVVYRAGPLNQTADCLSRLPLPAASFPPEDSEPELVALLATTPVSVTAKEFEDASSSCPELSSLRVQVQQRWPRSAKSVSPVLQPYFKIRHELSVQDSLVFRGSRLVVPISLRSTLVALAHEGHQGVVRTKQRLRDLYWFPGMDALVLSQVTECSLCQQTDKSAKVFQAPLQPVPLPEGPWEKLGLDIVGPFESATWDCKFAITLTDYYSKWPEVAFAPSVNSETVIQILSGLFCRYGNPECLVTDNGPQFTSASFSSFLRDKGIKHTRSSVYHPSSNGAVERFNRVFKGWIQAAIIQNKPWKSATSSSLQAYRATPHAMTGVSPFELMHGRKMRTTLNILPPPPLEQPAVDLRHRVSLRQSHVRQYCDAKRGARTPLFRAGDKVRVRKPVHVQKGQRQFSAPIRIKQQVGPSTYILDDGRAWHASHLASVPNRLPVCPSPPEAGTERVEMEPNQDHQALNRPVRSHKPPGWLKDFVM